MSGDNPMAAPGRLELVRRFVNTRDIEAGTDSVADAAGLRAWLMDAGLWRGSAGVRPGELERAHRLREALRSAAAANHDRSPVPDPALAVLDEVARRARVTLSFTKDHAWRAESRATGADGALGEIVIRVTESMTAGTWSRLKVCANDACGWAYFDSSRAGTGKWCTMRLCGNRAKQQAWRDRRAAPPATRTAASSGPGETGVRRHRRPSG
ncbi:CGNR zinc finger domain-containing protein [Asanoa sp. WMMD1127]|uniref:CGNR zinc finger domain-containing protein n=1 Tax=Asanoa sp. WMMD1127 TaxID=3016107 RepID=UPI00241612D2|nr:CGNR zinc finger domain-containing protein [Asanoa sp. WMMD1127]MDG4827542.1 CGNR zinc finger domain-containing protein [Asanoa sp. WMMD1127]